jgi:hypothetical protein
MSRRRKVRLPLSTETTVPSNCRSAAAPTGGSAAPAGEIAGTATAAPASAVTTILLVTFIP